MIRRGEGGWVGRAFMVARVAGSCPLMGPSKRPQQRATIKDSVGE
jgi:hypothetical protein